MLPLAASRSDRRIHQRSDYAGVLHLQCAGDSTWFAVHGVDVSAGGFAFVSDVEMRRGEQLSVTVPEFESFVVAAVVRHVKPAFGGFLVGIEFDEPLPAPFERCLCG
ncbi:MAG: hypothetical protein JWM53_5097 [bacterium]|nr:hypothetical protein [bacterium]